MIKKKTRPQNRYKPASEAPEVQKARAAAMKKSVFRLVGGIGLVLAMSAAAIWLHDAVVQSPFFIVRQIDISGTHRVSRQEVIALAGLDQEVNLYEIHLPAIEKQLADHPWISRAKVERRPLSNLVIQIIEQEPLAIVSLENLADIVINTQGDPFKEYEPDKDGLQDLPIITGVDLSLSETTCRFEGVMFDAVMDLLKVRDIGQIRSIQGDANTGLTIRILDVFNPEPVREVIPIKLGFQNFDQKLARARKISTYMAAHFPHKTIVAMDLYNMEKIFVRTENALHNTIEKGV